MIGKGKHGLVHYPKDPYRFTFDEEVAEVFDNMAVRSIPQYQESRRITVDIAVDRIKDRLLSMNKGTRVLDVGSSTGAFLSTLNSRLVIDTRIDQNNSVYTAAIEPSVPMRAKLRKNIPWLDHLYNNVLEAVEEGSGYDIINIAYVIQFIPPQDRLRFWGSMARLANKDCLVFMSTKEQVPHITRIHYDRLYREFRKSAGYTDGEIDAKNKALSNAMWLEPLDTTNAQAVSCGILPIHEVCRWLQFVTVMYTRG